MSEMKFLNAENFEKYVYKAAMSIIRKLPQLANKK